MTLAESLNPSFSGTWFLSGTARRTDRNNVPFNLFEQVYRDLFMDIVKDINIDEFTEVEVRNPATGVMVKHPSWQMPFTILGYAGTFAVPKYWIPKPGTRNEKWGIMRLNPLTGQAEPDIARDRYLRLFLTTDMCQSPLEWVVAEAERRVLPFIEGDRETILSIGGVKVRESVEISSTMNDQEKAEQNEQTLNPEDFKPPKKQ